MIPTYVFGWPTGQEKGDYLAVDLGTPYPLCLPRFKVKMLKPRWDQPPSVSGHSPRRRKVRDHTIEIPPH